MTEYKIGDRGPAGGWIFYDKGFYSDGWRYLEAAPEDIKVRRTSTFIFGIFQATAEGNNLFINGSSYKEGTSSVIDNKSTGTAIGTGAANTVKLVNKMGSAAYSSYSGNSTTANYAAKLCDDYTYGGYSDWFLPSKDELDLMYDNLKANGLGEFGFYEYWSSSEYSGGPQFAWFQNFFDGFQFSSGRCYDYNVRAIRAF